MENLTRLCITPLILLLDIASINLHNSDYSHVILIEKKKVTPWEQEILPNEIENCLL